MSTTVYLSTIDFGYKSVEATWVSPFSLAVIGSTTETVRLVTSAGNVDNAASYVQSSDSTPYTTHDFLSTATSIAAHHRTYATSTETSTQIISRLYADYIGALYVIRFAFTKNGSTKFFYFIGTSQPPEPEQQLFGVFGSIISLYGGKVSGWHSYKLTDTGLRMKFNATNPNTKTTNRDNVLLAERVTNKIFFDGQ